VIALAFRRHCATAVMAAASVAGEGPLFLAEYVLRVIRVAVLLTLWRIIFAGRGEVSGLTLAAVLTYTLVAQALANQLDPRTGIEDAMWNGTFVNHFSRPMGIVGQFVAEMLGRWAVVLLCFTLPLFLLAPLFGVDPRPASAASGALATLSLGLGVSVGVALDFIFGALFVIVDTGVWVIENVRRAVGVLLSGALLPLALLPWGLGDIFSWLPFAAVASAPLRIYTATGDPRALMASQVLWSLILWPLALWMWRANRERLTGYGGGG
jgi:ABC-2 type transport system permease protein